MPLRILSMPTAIRRFLVASCLADVTQQIHSFRASGVMSTQSLWAAASDSIASRRSAGSLWTVPSASLEVVIGRVFLSGLWMGIILELKTSSRRAGHAAYSIGSRDENPATTRGPGPPAARLSA